MRIDGRTNPEQRSFFCDKFQDNEDVRLALLSITAANAGINLTAASLVVFAELFWNPGVSQSFLNRSILRSCPNVYALVILTYSSW